MSPWQGGGASGQRVKAMKAHVRSYVLVAPEVRCAVAASLSRTVVRAKKARFVARVVAGLICVVNLVPAFAAAGSYPSPDEPQEAQTFVLVPEEQTATQPRQENRGEESQKSEVAQQSAEELHEVVVTGTHIRGVSPASPLIVLTSADIANSGYTTAGDVLRNLPQSFAGGQQSTIGTNGNGAGQNLENFNNSDSANLRGFGSDSTLVLINGLRAPVTGLQGSVDISAIPLNAIDRIEIVTDGASALYGSDAVGGVVNFILKRDYSGGETSAEVGDLTDGGGISQRYGQLLGTSWGTGSAMLTYQYRDQDGLYGDQRSWWTGPNPYSLVGSIHQNSAYLSLSQSVAPDLALFAQGMYNRTTAFNIVAHPDSDDTSFLYNVGYSYMSAIGATLKLPREWELTATAELGADRFDHHEIDPCCDFNIQIIPTNRLALGELQADGALFRLPSGELRAAIGAGFRHDSLESISFSAASGARDISYGYGELTVPILGKEIARVGAQELTLTLAGRYEDYSDVGGHFSPDVGLVFKPVDSLRLRATWNKSFHAPDLDEKYSNYYVLLNYPVEAPGGGTTNAVIPAGGSSTLRPETARSYTFGLDWQPRDTKLRVSATYFNISYTNRIIQPIVDPTPVLLDPIYAPLVTLNPSAAAQESLINGTSTVENVTGAPFNPSETGAIIDDRFINVSSQTATGADLLATYAIGSRAGTFAPFFNGNVFSLRQRLTSAAPVQTISGLVFYPSKYKLRGGLTWQGREWGGTATVNYTAAETNNLIEPQTQIGAWYTLDLQGRYAFSLPRGPASGLSLSLSILNVFNKDPPIVNGYSDVYDNTQASPYGRIVKLKVEKEW
jgi:iron complex outermembrane receptor protein